MAGTTSDGYTITAANGDLSVKSPDGSTSGIGRDGRVWVAGGRELLLPGQPTSAAVADQPARPIPHGLGESWHADLGLYGPPLIIKHDDVVRAPSSSYAPTPVEIAVELDEPTKSRIAEWVEHALKGTHYIHSAAEVVEMLADATAHVTGSGGSAAAVASGAEVVAVFLEPAIPFVVAYETGHEIITAFGSGKRMEHAQGFVYGVMWQAMGEPDHLPSFDGIFRLGTSPDELRQAFMQGVARGRAKAQDPTIRNRILLAVSSLGVTSGKGAPYAAQILLSQLWRSTRERSPADSESDTIAWPVPYDRN